MSIPVGSLEVHLEFVCALRIGSFLCTTVVMQHLRNFTTEFYAIRAQSLYLRPGDKESLIVSGSLYMIPTSVSSLSDTRHHVHFFDDSGWQTL